MKCLQHSYNRFYDVIMEAVDNIEQVSKAKQIKLDEIGKCPVYETGLFDLFSLQSAVIAPMFSLVVMSVKEDDNITLRDRLYGDFIDKNYKEEFIKNIKNKNNEGLEELGKKAVVEIFKLKNR